jgi:hypothetical protein
MSFMAVLAFPWDSGLLFLLWWYTTVDPGYRRNGVWVRAIISCYKIPVLATKIQGCFVIAILIFNRYISIGIHFIS